jgi:hypothetical protein
MSLPEPLKVTGGRSMARASLEVNRTVPRYALATAPAASRAVTVMLSAFPAMVLSGSPPMSKRVAGGSPPSVAGGSLPPSGCPPLVELVREQAHKRTQAKVQPSSRALQQWRIESPLCR